MILVDTSIWVEFFSGRGRKPQREDYVRFVTCGPVVQEVFQGLRPARESELVRESFLALPRVSDPVPLDVYVHAAEIFTEGRRRGITIRSSADCLISAIAIANRIPVWHRDRDFTLISGFTPLRVAG
jgi:hypothetical protein